eukprot:10715192-Alexandrium_andersonii.AAC.1
MSASLVGSEMCIRDREYADADAFNQRLKAPQSAQDCIILHSPAHSRIMPVSYTHLTLPTICSV